MTDSGLAAQGITLLKTTGSLTAADRWEHIQARFGIRRGEHRVDAGLYALGAPGPEAPVFVTANYSLSFDALRSAIAGMDAYILVLDTFGINVWCAAGKGTFGTEELVRRMEVTRLDEVVNHRRIILPQLGAAGVSAPEVKKQTGFRVEYGPIRAEDIPEYMQTHKATPQMRLARFNLWDRAVLVPVEAAAVLLPMLIASAAAYFLTGALSAWAVAAACLAGAALFPLLLPWIPTHDFSVKGYILGVVCMLPFSLGAALGGGGITWQKGVLGLALLLALPPVTAFLSLNFTGSTPFTSRTGVKKEIYAYIPAMGILFGIGVLAALAMGVLHLLGRA